jgi:small subunit ribosomal protein S20
MPHTESAKKRLRQNEVRRVRNKDRTTELKSIRKNVLRALHDGQPAKAEELYRDFTKRVDQAAAGNTIHRNTAARAKSRLAIAITAAAKAVGEKAKATAPANPA